MGSDSHGGSDVRIALTASWIIVVVIVAQGTLSMLSQVTDELTAITRSAGVLTTIACAALFVTVQQRVVKYRLVPPSMVALVFVLAVVGFFVGTWLTAALALGVLALALTRWHFWVTAALFVGVLSASMFGQDVNAIDGFFYVLVVAVIGLMLYVFTRLALTVGELERARETVARMRVDEERHRISRDLHDIMGRSLVAVSLRTQTAISYLGSDQKRCGEQLEEVAKMVTEGQSQLRGLTRGETVLGFEDELAAARELFDRLGVRCSTDISTQNIGDVVNNFGSRVLRECVTNLLKHSRPSLVEISLRQESATNVLVILNNGAVTMQKHEGTGLTALAERARSLGATLDAAHVSGARFRVIARMPQDHTTEPNVASAPSSLGAQR